MNAHCLTMADYAATDDNGFEFDFDGTLIRGVMIDGEAWLVAGEVATALGHAKATDLTRTLDDDEKGTHVVRTPGGRQAVLFVSAPGLYKAILQRRGIKKLPGATRDRIERFQRRVFHDVLPTIQRTGTYSTAPLPIPVPVQIDVRDRGQLAVIASQLVALTAELQAELGQEREAHAETHQHLEDTTRMLRIESHARQETTVALADAHVRIEAQRPAVVAQARIAASDECLSASEAAVILLPRSSSASSPSGTSRGFRPATGSGSGA